MGKVIKMSDWRNRLPKRLTDREVVINEIKRLLMLSAEATRSVRTLGSVHEREDAVVKGLQYHMKAHSYAERHGLKIGRTEDANGNTWYRIID